MEGPHRTGEREEHPPLLVGRTAVPEIFDQCCADLLGQGQHSLAAALAGAQAELPRPPVQVVELKGGDLPARRPRRASSSRIARSRYCAGRGAAARSSSCASCSEERCGGRRGVPCAPDARDGAVQPAWRSAAPSKETQEGARRARGRLAAVSRSLCSLPAYELGHLLDGPEPVNDFDTAGFGI